LPSGYGPVKVVPNSKVSIGFMVVADNESNVAAVKAAKLEAKRLGASLTVLYDHVKADQQVTNFGQLINAKVDGIIFYPLDPKASRPSIAKAKKEGILLFAQDATLPGQPLDPNINSTIISARDHQAYMQVQYMASVKPHAKIVVIGLGFPVAALEYYITRVKYWAGKFGLTVLGRGDNPSDNESGGEQAMNGLLGKYADFDGVIAYNDPSALGAAAAARANGRKITAIGLNGGSDGRSGVEHGRTAATVQTDYPDQLVTLIDGIYLMKTHQLTKVPRVIQAKNVLVTPANINSVPSWDTELKALAAKK